jgi:hypothetical protein
MVALRADELEAVFYHVETKLAAEHVRTNSPFSRHSKAKRTKPELKTRIKRTKNMSSENYDSEHEKPASKTFKTGVRNCTFRRLAHRMFRPPTAQVGQTGLFSSSSSEKP